ncbi:hypothetical protein ACVWY1_002425 [Pseudomonas sp. TE6288]
MIRKQIDSSCNSPSVSTAAMPSSRHESPAR